MTAYLRARLVGGPFDGDVGTLSYDDLPYGMTVEPPESVWVWRCPEPHCDAGGTHWSPVQEEAEGQAARYDHDEDEEPDDGWHTYVYGEALLPALAVEAEEMALA